MSPRWRSKGLETPTVSQLRQKIFEIGYGHFASAALLGALRLGLLEALSEKPQSAQSLARKLRANARATELLLDALTGLGLIRKKGEQFAHHRGASRLFRKGDPLTVLDFLRFHEPAAQGMFAVDEAVRKGKPVLPPEMLYNDSKMLEGFIRSMDNTATGHAEILAQRLPLASARSLIDIGAGSGAFSAHFLKRNPRLRATLFDLPETLPFTRKLVGRFGLNGRIHFQAGDILEDSIRGSYDAAFLSHMIHGFSVEQNQTIFRKVFGCLNPGGCIVIQDFILDRDRTSPSFGSLFALLMLIATEQGRTYSFEETSRMLKEAGFIKPRQRKLGLPRGISIVQARKPSHAV
ncbi:MAG: methyltransferase [Candidatus Omnitrophota bacterium]